jgi:hypothetical protein
MYLICTSSSASLSLNFYILKAINSSESHPMKILPSLVSIDPVVSEKKLKM